MFEDWAAPSICVYSLSHVNHKDNNVSHINSRDIHRQYAYIRKYELKQGLEIRGLSLSTKLSQQASYRS